MKILLTGASGFIGKNFLEFAPRDIEIIGIYNSCKDIHDLVEDKKLDNVKLHKCDLTDENETKTLFEKIGNNFEYCIFLAGNVNVPLSKKDPNKDIEITVSSLINTLQNCKIKRLVYMSTAGVYDGLKGNVNPAAKLDPKVPYCISKLMAEQYIKYFHSIGRTNQYVILRFSGAFGKYSEKKFMTKLVKDMHVNNKKEIEIYGRGDNFINVMYVKDVVKALIKCVESEKSNLICNLGLENMNISEAVERTAKTLGKDIRIANKPKLEEQKYITFTYDSDFNEIFGFKPDYSFEEGIREFGEILKNED